MFGDIKVSFGGTTNFIYVVLAKRDLCLRPKSIEQDLTQLTAEELRTVISLCQTRIKYTGKNFVAKEIAEAVDKMEILSASQNGRKARGLFDRWAGK